LKEYLSKETRKIIRIGNSFAVTLPKDYLVAHNLKCGDKMDLYFDEVLHAEPIKEEDILKKLGRGKE